jgi:hypothetical protein
LRVGLRLRGVVEGRSGEVGGRNKIAKVLYV